MKKKDGNDIEAIIWKAVETTRVASERSIKDAYRATERRLYALPDIRAKLKDDEESLAEVKEHGVRNRSHSVTRFLKSGVRLSPEEVLAAVMMDLEASIAASEHEIDTISEKKRSTKPTEVWYTQTG